jgi:hypothetical protein
LVVLSHLSAESILSAFYNIPMDGPFVEIVGIDEGGREQHRNRGWTEVIDAVLGFNTVQNLR